MSLGCASIIVVVIFLMVCSMAILMQQLQSPKVWKVLTRPRWLTLAHCGGFFGHKRQPRDGNLYQLSRILRSSSRGKTVGVKPSGHESLPWISAPVTPAATSAHGSHVPCGEFTALCTAGASTEDAAPQSIPAKMFFEGLFGFKEDVSDLQCVYDNLQVDYGKDGVMLHSKANGRTFGCGAFDMRSLAELQRSVKVPRQDGTLSLIIGKGSKSVNVRQVDVGAMQADPNNRGATFQVASNFNCLEFVSPHDSAANGVSKYIYDLTQGPAASISCAPALIYRNYFIRHSRNGAEYTGQLTRQINLLQDLPLDVVNGYVSLTGPSVEKLAVVTADSERYLPLVRIGVHQDVQVTSGLKGEMVEICSDPQQLVTQIFTAATNLADLSPAMQTDPRVVGVAKLLLRAAYKSTILAGIASSQRQHGMVDRPGRNTLYLTLIGGGVFANKMAWIYDAIQENQQLIQSSGLDVRLVIYNRKSLAAKDLAAFESLALVTGGNVTAVN